MTNTTISQLPSGSPIQNGDLAAISRDAGGGAYNSKRVELGTMASQSADNVDITGGTISNVVMTNVIIPALNYNPQFVTVSGNINVIPYKTLVGVENNTASAVTVFLLPSASGTPVIIKDVLGMCGTNNITIIPNGAEDIDGQSSLVMNVNYSAFSLAPKTNGWMITA